MIDPKKLHGHWTLADFKEQAADGSWFDAVGPGMRGVISYWPQGYVQVHQGSSARPQLKGAWGDIPAAEKAACLDLMVAYSGTYTVGEDRVTQHVNFCWIPNWEGRDLVRLVSFPKEGQLLLNTVPTSGGRALPAQSVLWERSPPVR